MTAQLDSRAVCVCSELVVVSVCPVEYLPNLIDDFIAVRLTDYLFD